MFQLVFIINCSGKYAFEFTFLEFYKPNDYSHVYSTWQIKTINNVNLNLSEYHDGLEKVEV